MLQAGNFRVLVLRAIGKDASSPASDLLSDSIFGTHGDPVNLNSQYKACSYGLLSFQPVPNKGTDGVYDVDIKRLKISGSHEYVIRDAVVGKAISDLGKLNSFADYVIVCLPPGTKGSWIAYVSTVDVTTICSTDLEMGEQLTYGHRHLSTIGYLSTIIIGALLLLPLCMK